MLGYCVLPLTVALIICKLVLIAQPQTTILFVVRCFIVLLAFAWSTFGKFECQKPRIRPLFVSVFIPIARGLGMSNPAIPSFARLFQRRRRSCRTASRRGARRSPSIRSSCSTSSSVGSSSRTRTTDENRTVSLHKLCGNYGKHGPLKRTCFTLNTGSNPQFFNELGPCDGLLVHHGCTVNWSLC